MVNTYLCSETYRGLSKTKALYKTYHYWNMVHKLSLGYIDSPDASFSYRAAASEAHYFIQLMRDSLRLDRPLSEGKTALYQMVEEKDIAGAAFLLYHGAKPHVENMKNPLEIAVLNEDTRMKQLLQCFGAKTDSGAQLPDFRAADCPPPEDWVDLPTPMSTAWLFAMVHSSHDSL